MKSIHFFPFPAKVAAFLLLLSIPILGTGYKKEAPVLSAPTHTVPLAPDTISPEWNRPCKDTGASDEQCNECACDSLFERCALCADCIPCSAEEEPNATPNSSASRSTVRLSVDHAWAQ